MFWAHRTIDCQDEAQRPLIEEAVDFAIATLVPKIRNLDIEVDALEFVGDEAYECGYCTRIDYRYFFFEVAQNQSEESLVRTIIHEMVHVKQYVYGELNQYHSKVSGLRIQWKGEDHTNTTYTEQPWEIEAYDLEERLYNEFCNNRS